jgi:hypothetical protein
MIKTPISKNGLELWICLEFGAWNLGFQNRLF